MLQEFAELYGDIGLTGCIVACFLWLIYSMNTRATSQAEALEALRIENEGQSKQIESIYAVVIKFLDRWNRSDETRDRRHEDMVKEVNSLSDVMMEVKGSVSRINGRH